MTDDEPKPRLDRIHPVVGFVGGILGGYGVARAVYTDAGLVELIEKERRAGVLKLR